MGRKRSYFDFWKEKIVINDNYSNQSVASQRFISKFFALPKFAHHPTCKCFNHHLLRFGSYSFCLGCSSLGMGVIFCISLLIFTMIFKPIQTKELNPWLVVFLGTLFTTPTFIQPFFQKKCFKILSRASLGFGITVLWLGAMCLLSWDASGLILRGVFILIFIFFFKLSLKFRNHYTTKTICTCGPNAYPYCPENQIRKEKLLHQFLKLSDKSDPMIPIIQTLAKAQQFNIPVAMEDKISTLTIEYSPVSK